MDTTSNAPRFDGSSLNLQLWLTPAELRRAQARKVMERLEARKLDKRLEKEWAR